MIDTLKLIDEVRQRRSKNSAIPDGDVAGAITDSYERWSGCALRHDGTPEGVISAAALKCLGGEMQGRLWPRNRTERQAAIDAGYDLDRILDTDDLVDLMMCFSPLQVSLMASCCGVCDLQPKALSPTPWS